MIKEYRINEIVNIDNSTPLKINNIKYKVPFNINNKIVEVPVYEIIYNNQYYYLSHFALLYGNREMLNRSISDIGYNGYIDINKFHKEYSLWKNMINRCYNKNSLLYNQYGYNGITIIPYWLCFELFYYDIITLPTYNRFISSSNEYELNLINSSLPYRKDNVILRTLQNSDVGKAINEAKTSGYNIQCNTIDKPIDKKKDLKKYKPLKNGNYPYSAYQQTINNPPSLVCIDTKINTNYYNTFNGIVYKK